MDRAWQRRRSPDDVPTPLAVAVSDFCRRSGHAASPAEVREALSLLAEEEDFRVRALTDGEPEAEQLSPFAVVDVLSGTSEALAATRESCGYYALVRQLVSERERIAPPAPAASAASPTSGPIAAPPSVAAWSPASAASLASPAARGKEKKPPKPSVEDRIAPTRRRAGSAESSSTMTEDLAPLAPASPREDRTPKGRYSLVSPAKESVEFLFQGQGRAVLAHAVEQFPDRYAMTRSLSEVYAGRKEGQPLRTEDLERALQHHGLYEQLERKEREAVLASYTDQRGAGRRTANDLRLSTTELQKLVRSLGVEQEIEGIRERFRREALTSQRLGARLDLLGREKYLQDLGIARKFDDRLREDLQKLLRRHAEKANSGRDLILIAARMEGAPAELLWRAVEKLGLTSEVRSLFPDDPDSNYAP